MIETKNFMLKKPDYDDGADIGVINQNADIIDEELKKSEDEINAHTSDTCHIQAGEREKWDASGVSTYKHEKTGTVHNLKGTGNNIEFFATADIADGDTWTVNGQPVTATLSNGEPLTEDTFKNGNWVTGVRLDGDKLNFRGGGGGGCKPNIFCQPTLPTKKFEGITLITNDKFKKVVVDDKVYESGLWDEINNNIPTGRLYMGCAKRNNEIYCIGGVGGDPYQSDKVEVFNINTKTWTIKNNLPKKVGECHCLNVNNTLVVTGSTYSDYRGGVWIYTYSTDTWEQTRNSIQIINGYGIVNDNNYTYVLSGEPKYSDKKCCHRYDSLSFDNYKCLADIPTPRSYFGYVLYNNKIYCFGGKNANGSTEIYNIATDTWTVGTYMPKNLEYFKAIRIDEKIYCMPSQDDNSNFNDEIFVYDINSNTWSISKTTIPSNYKKIKYGTVLADNNTIYLIGGQSEKGPTEKNIISYTVKSKQYAENTFVIFENLLSHKYQTQLFTAKLINGRALTYFNNAWLFKDGDLQNYPAYYGNGSSWIKFK